MSRWPAVLSLVAGIISLLAIAPVHAQDTAPPADPPGAAAGGAASETNVDIEELRQSIQRLKERVAEFASEFAEGGAGGRDELAALRAASLANLERVTELQFEAGVAIETEPSLAAANRALQDELDATRQQVATLEQQRASGEQELVAVQAELARATAEIDDLRAAAAAQEDSAPVPAPVVLRDPEDVARLEQAATALAQSEQRLAALSQQSDRLRDELEVCSQTMVAAANRPASPADQQLAALEAENTALQDEVGTASRRLADAMAIAEQCITGVGGRDQQLQQALQRIEALEAALQRARD